MSETRKGVKANMVCWGAPGETDENILVMGHTDGWFEAGVDNASGASVMLGLADILLKDSERERRRT